MIHLKNKEPKRISSKSELQDYFYYKSISNNQNLNTT